MNSQLNSLAQRVQFCAARVGSKRALAVASGISEAQLYRYAVGDAILPSDRLLAIATASKVDVLWLLTGEGSPSGPPPADPRPTFNPQLLTALTQAFEELLFEYEKPLTARQRAHALSLMYQAFRHEEQMLGETTTERARIVSALHFLGHESFDDAVATLSELLEVDNHKKIERASTTVWAIRIANMASRCNRNWYDSYSGEAYFERIGVNVPPRYAAILLEKLELARSHCKRKNLSWLDLGCGNGRELSFLQRHGEGIDLKGIEISGMGCKLAHALEASGKLFPGTVLQGDFRLLPFKDGQFDVVYNRMSLWCTPYIPGSGSGAEEMFSEATRVLRPGGLFIVRTVGGSGRIYLPFVQFHSEETLQELATSNKLELLTVKKSPPMEDSPFYLRGPILDVVFIKPA